MRTLPYGPSAVLVELADPRLVPALQRRLAARPDVVDAVAGATTVLAVVAPGSVGALRRELDGWDEDALSTSSAATPPPRVRLPVRYDGADLAAVAEHAGLSVEQVVARHAGARYVVRFCGFSPGFAYLDGLDPLLHVARRAEPRARVPAGSVAIAGGFTGVYPRASPGGWQLLGRTDAVLWRTDRDGPALLVPGTVVHLDPV